LLLREEDIITLPPSPKAVRSTQETAPSYKECPFCSEQIRATAKKCKHCGETLDVVLRAAEEERRAVRGRQAEDDDEEDMPVITCPDCGRTVWKRPLRRLTMPMR
jgi:hypothetical protein